MSLRSQKIKLPGFPRFDKDFLRRYIKFRSKDRGFFRRFKHIYFLSDLSFDTKVPDLININSLDEVSPEKIRASLFLVYYDTDDDFVNALREIKAAGGKYLCLPIWKPKTRYRWTNRNAVLALDDTYKNKDKVSHWNVEIHETIIQALEVTRNLPGAFVEIGVYKGGSALTVLNYLKRAPFVDPQRPVYLLDTFEGFNYAEARRSFDVHWQGTHKLWGVQETMKLLRNKVFDPVGIPYDLRLCNICRDELPSEIDQIAVCNVDVDIYDATKMALEKVGPKMVKGGIIICEDPTSTPGLGGALLAMTEFLGTDLGKSFMKLLVGGQYYLIKMD